MNSIETAAIVFGCSFGMGLLGMVLNFRLPDEHLDAGSRDVVKLVMGLIATMSALVLSLLIASGTSSYQAQQNEMQSASANVILLDRVLSYYGPEAKGSRDLLRQGFSDTYDRIWSPEGAFSSKLDPRATQRVADHFIASLKDLAPKSDAQATLKSQAMQIAQNLAQTRLLMFEQVGSSFAWPFLTVLVFWVCMLFLGFGLLARFNPILLAAQFIGAVSVAGAIFLILELSSPYKGFMRISDAPVRDALTIIDK
jgi:uncharacterized membrane protein (DUF485 family)